MALLGTTWLDQLRTASWRDVPFQVDTIEMTDGDNTVLREYPFQDLPTVFRMGAGANEIKFSAYVVGDDYLDQLNRLRQVLTGDGVLVHPTQGSIRCWCNGKYTVKEAPASEGGCARLELSFIRAEPRRYPVGVSNTADQVADAADSAEQSLIDSLAANLDLSKLTGWAHDNVLSRIRSGLDTLWDGISFVNRIYDTYNSLVRQYITFPLNELAAIPSILGRRISDLTKIPETLTSNEAWSAFGAARNLWKAPTATRSLLSQATPPSPSGLPQAISPAIAAAYAPAGFVPSAAQAKLAEAFTPPVSPYQTAARQAEAQSLKTLELFFNGVVTIMAVRAVAQIELENYDQALALRTDFNQQITELILASAAEPVGGVGATTTHDALVRLKTAVLADLQARSRDLARLTTYTPESWQPALYVSYRMFGTVRWADEIVAMNPHIRHPLLVPPGTPLRVIKHD
ncbi:MULTISPECIES: DNA circularization protein [Burkholderia cepacia complex]|uniref:DNA circularization protein n=1 Tax=Burkholderia cepacia complex TaxID=87882 RepID=UPI000D0148B1|nr:MULTISPECIES: DNA circularization N-terminal domain-containing protein [Burkholderia cepacia complex]MBR8434286.1 DNA circularization N-terminal domain-containing protein [Burkholderia cenocepacia]MEB2508925.1 DNA circularization N-terminal domain-containing protein [Burkholderia multivorans]MEB2520016.1 DNA circularization N-terminal domain-containing protein [Burkholderia multivorans]MEB2572501.1 DNA circularization N-terminal domain-containing protein [Burkholderia multivorans]MEB2590351